MVLGDLLRPYGDLLAQIGAVFGVGEAVGSSMPPDAPARWSLREVSLLRGPPGCARAWAWPGRRVWQHRGMAAHEVPPSHDTYYLDATARTFGWEVTREGENLTMSLADRTVRAVFWHDGGFRYARCTGPGSSGTELTLAQLVDLLEEHGTPAP